MKGLLLTAALALGTTLGLGAIPAQAQGYGGHGGFHGGGSVHGGGGGYHGGGYRGDYRGGGYRGGC